MKICNDELSLSLLLHAIFLLFMSLAVLIGSFVCFIL